MKKLVIALDGPSGTGKSSVGRALAQKLGYVFLSTGELYRALGYKALESGVDMADAGAVSTLAAKINFTFEPQPDAVLRMLVDGVYLGDKLHSDAVAQAGSKTSAVGAAREILTKIMRAQGSKGGIVMEGRDIGTVVFPKADYKFFITASAKERASRRFKQLAARGESADYNELLKSIEERDHRDSTRAVAPLRPAAKAVVVDTSRIDLEQVTQRLFDTVQHSFEKKTLKERLAQYLLNLIKLSFRTYLRVFHGARAEGLENMPADGRLIIVSNHASNIDPVLIGGFEGLVRDSVFLVKKELMDVPVMGRLLKLYKFIPVDRKDAAKDMGVIKSVMKVLNKERSICMFPEGTRSKDGSLGKAKRGVSIAAHRTGSPVLICRLFDTYKYPKTRSIRVKYSHLIWFEEDKDRDIKEQYDEFAEKIMQEISKVK